MTVQAPGWNRLQALPAERVRYLDLIIEAAAIGACAALAVLIACLGLFALSAYATERRTRESFAVARARPASALRYE